MKEKKLMKNDFSKSILKRIKKEKITQVPKMFFITKNIFIWILLFFMMMLGAISLSISFEYLIGADWSLLSKIGFVKILSVFLPLFWLISLILSTLFAYKDFKSTKNGYKYSFTKILFINISVSIFFAVIFFFAGVSDYIDTKLEQTFPKYRSVLVEDKVSRMLQVWQNEEAGLLIGEIISVKSDLIQLKDFNKKLWEISLDNNTVTDVKHRVNIEVGEKIKIIGEKIDEKQFKAFEIRPFMGKNGKISRGYSD